MSKQTMDLGAVTAYALAVKNGFTGTEKQWLDSLPGKDGVDGKDGTNGTKVTAEVDTTTKKTTLVLQDGDTTKRVELGGVGQGTAEGGEIFGDLENNHATEQYAHAEGQGTSAKGGCSHAEGTGTVAGASMAHAEGWGSEANGAYSHAEGRNTVASGENSHAEGLGSTASGASSHAEGQGHATGTISHAEGGATAAGGGSHAEAYSTATGEGSHAEGVGTDAKGTYSHVEGAGAKTDTNAFAAHAEGQGTKANGNSAHAEGNQTTAGGAASHAEGANNTASGDYSHVEGQGSTASGECGHAEGMGSTASGQASHAEGVGTAAAAQGQHVQGKYNVEDTAGTYAHIVGGGTGDTDRKNIQTLDWDGNEKVAGDFENGEGDKLHDVAGKLEKNQGKDNAGKALLVGESGEVEPKGLAEVMPVIKSIQHVGDDVYTGTTYVTIQNGEEEDGFSVPATHVGRTNAAGGEMFNSGVSANGSCAHAEGNATVASSNCQHVFGRCNVEDTEDKYLEIVGNGDTDPHAPNGRAAPSNARTLDWDGNEWVAGDYTNGKGDTLHGVAQKVSEVKERHAILGSDGGEVADAAKLKFEGATVSSDGETVTVSGLKGADGSNGVSPTVQVESIDGGHRVTITDAAGTNTVDVMDGKDGAAGKDGSDGAPGKDGAAGATGATPQLSIGTVKTLEPWEAATAELTGTAENPVLNLGIPRGQYSEVGAYGVEFSGSTSAGTRTGLAKSFAFTPGTDTVAGTNDFDAVYPWAGMRRCCCTLNSDGTVTVNAYKGQPGYTEDGSNGEVLVEVPKFYVSGMLDVNPQVSMFKLDGFRLPKKFQRADGTEKSVCYLRAFPGSIGADGKLHSIAGAVPTSNRNINQFMTAARLWGETYSIGTSADFEVLAYLMIVVYGTRHFQQKINGVVSLYSTNIAIAAARTDEAAVTVAKGVLEPGMVISIGTGSENESVAYRRIVTVVEAIDGDTANVKVSFSGDPVTTTTDHKVWRMFQSTGTANSVVATCGSPVSNTDGRHSFVFYGVENPLYGNQWRMEADWKLIDGVPYYCDDPTKYQWTSATDYTKLDSLELPGEGWVTALQADERFPWLQITKSIGGNSSTYLADYFWINKSGTRIVRRGGASYSGGNAGPWYISLANGAGPAWWSTAADLSIPG